MTKKSFKEAPVMQFISSATKLDEAPTRTEADPTPEEVRKLVAAGIPEGYKLNPVFIERRTKRAQLVFQPSLYEKGAKLAKDKGISFNELIHRLLETAVETEEASL